MKFLIPVNEAAEGESQTCMVVDVGDVTERTAKRKLRLVFKEWGIPAPQIKRLLKEYF